ncbi:hypothetical protein [Tepidibacter aestuarii]|uniref:hypothetical protein n=1 Tax=Tepidibacter aestuarii TaxID=2925782 RepID=UPI0020BF5621|nr:hypothetical protein [Tepidibacter aestuarii]CAH2213264.1 protein of unknown function [Tepidibacter aestuarii]
MYTDKLQILINSLDFSIDKLENQLKYNSNYLSIEQKNYIRSTIKDYKNIQLETKSISANNN